MENKEKGVVFPLKLFFSITSSRDVSLQISVHMLVSLHSFWLFEAYSLVDLSGSVHGSIMP